jgi:hypothetical protein
MLITALVALHIARHNTLTTYRIKAISFEKELKIEEAKKRGLELEMATFTSPLRLEEVAEKAQYSYLRQPSVDETLLLVEKES